MPEASRRVTVLTRGRAALSWQLLGISMCGTPLSWPPRASSDCNSSGFVAVEIPFTPRAKRVLELALEEARQLGHSYIGTEHLLLGLLREGEGVAARVLENLDADPAKIRSQVRSLFQPIVSVEAKSEAA